MGGLWGFENVAQPIHTGPSAGVLPELVSSVGGIATNVMKQKAAEEAQRRARELAVAKLDQTGELARQKQASADRFHADDQAMKLGGLQVQQRAEDRQGARQSELDRQAAVKERLATETRNLAPAADTEKAYAKNWSGPAMASLHGDLEQAKQNPGAKAGRYDPPELPPGVQGPKEAPQTLEQRVGVIRSLIPDRLAKDAADRDRAANSKAASGRAPKDNAFVKPLLNQQSREVQAGAKAAGIDVNMMGEILRGAMPPEAAKLSAEQQKIVGQHRARYDAIGKEIQRVKVFSPGDARGVPSIPFEAEPPPTFQVQPAPSASTEGGPSQEEIAAFQQRQVATAKDPNQRAILMKEFPHFFKPS